MTETAKDGTVLGIDPQVDSQYIKDAAGDWVRKPNVDSRGRTPEQVKVWKAYDTHCDFCETCAMYKQGDDTDSCYAGQVLWSCFYGIPYPARKLSRKYDGNERAISAHSRVPELWLVQRPVCAYHVRCRKPLQILLSRV